MLEFANPAWLLLLLLAPAVIWLWLRRGRGGLRYSDTQIFTGLAQGRSARARFWGVALRTAGLVFSIVALAGPRWPDQASRIPTEGISVVLVVDVSASMNERDFVWDDKAITRLEGVKKIFRLFVAGGAGPDGVKLEPRGNDLIGLVTFATYPDMPCPLTLDHEALLKILDAETARTVAGEAMTNPGDAIAWALGALRTAPTRRKVIIFLTDGESNVDRPALTPWQAGQLAGNLGVPIYAIDAGNEPANDDDQGSTNKPGNSLEKVASLSLGKYFKADDGKALAEAVAQIDRLERDKIESFQFRRYYELFPWLVLLALLSLVSISVLEATRWRRIPV